MDADSLATESFSEAPAATAGVDLTCRVSQVSRRAPMMPSTALAAYGNGARDGPVKRAREVADAWLSSRPRASRAGHQRGHPSRYRSISTAKAGEELVAACGPPRRRRGERREDVRHRHVAAASGAASSTTVTRAGAVVRGDARTGCCGRGRSRAPKRWRLGVALLARVARDRSAPVVCYASPFW